MAKLTNIFRRRKKHPIRNFFRATTKELREVINSAWNNSKSHLIAFGKNVFLMNFIKAISVLNFFVLGFVENMI